MLELGAYILIVVVALIGFQATANQQADLNESQSCTEGFLAATVKVLESRTSTTSEVSRADRDQQEYWSDYIQWPLDQALKGTAQDPAVAQENINRVRTYGKKVQAYLDAVRKQQESREDNPYPSREQYRNCLEGDK